MKVGTIKETKVEEYRVGLTPSGSNALTQAGHDVFVERGAGEGSGFSDEQYADAGATLSSTPQDVSATVDLLVKVKEPLEPEFSLLRPGLILFTYLHLAPLPDLTHALIESRTHAIAYETVRRPDGSLPLLIPMSQVAGRMPPRSPRSSSRGRAQAVASSSAASPALRRQEPSLLAAVMSALLPPASSLRSARASPSPRRTFSASRASNPSSESASQRGSRARSCSKRSSVMPTYSSERC